LPVGPAHAQLVPPEVLEPIRRQGRTASGFCYHVGVIFGGLVPPVISYFAVEQQMGFAMPMMIGTVVGAGSVVIALPISPETKGKVFVSHLMSH
jgi:MFS transporter, SHS family, lactate transporter